MLKSISINHKIFVYLSAILVISYGTAELSKNLAILQFIYKFNPLTHGNFSQYLMVATFSTILMYIIPSTAILSGILILKWKEWGRRLIIDIALILYFYGLFTAFGRALLELWPQDQFITIQFDLTATVVYAVSLWPTYILSFSAIFLLFLLTRPKVKEYFK